MAIETYQCARHSLVSRSCIEPTIVGPPKQFQNKSSQKVGKPSFGIGFCKYL